MRASAALAGAGMLAVAIVALSAQSPEPPSLKNPKTLTETAPAKFRARFETNKGAFVIEVTRAWAPIGADRFYNLVKHGFFNENRFFRVVPEALAQFGLSGDPATSAAWFDATIPDDVRQQTNERGYVSFASVGPRTRTTQIFVNLGDNQTLDKVGFVPFGKVASGLSVFDKLYSGYGDGPPKGKGVDQFKLISEGQEYLKAFPKLDYITTAALVDMNAKD